MSPIIKRLLHQYGIDDLDPSFEALARPDFIQFITPEMAYKMVLDHPLLQLEYSVACNRLLTHLEKEEENENDPEWIKQELKSALILSKILEHLYLKYLNVPRLVRTNREQQSVYFEVVKYLDATPQAIEFEMKPILVGRAISSNIRDYTMHWNWYRLFFVRLKRLFNVIQTFEGCVEGFHQFMGHVDLVFNPVIAFLAWAFLTPRLLTNLTLLFKHTFGYDYLSPEEQSLGWFARFIAQLQRRWFELANDLVWVTVGFINCFFLVGPLAPIGAYINVTFFAYDMILSATRVTIELGRIVKLQQQYSTLLSQTTDGNERREILEYKEFLTDRTHYEMKRLGLHFAITAAIFLSMCLMIPAFVSNPVLPLIGVIGLLMTSIIGFILTRAVEAHRPAEQLNKASVSSLGMFANRQPKQEPPEKSPSPDTQCVQ